MHAFACLAYRALCFAQLERLLGKHRIELARKQGLLSRALFSKALVRVHHTIFAAPGHVLQSAQAWLRLDRLREKERERECVSIPHKSTGNTTKPPALPRPSTLPGIPLDPAQSPPEFPED